MLDKVWVIKVNEDFNGKGQIYGDKFYIFKGEASFLADKLNEEDFDNEYKVVPLTLGIVK